MYTDIQMWNMYTDSVEFKEVSGSGKVDYWEAWLCVNNDSDYNRSRRHIVT